MFAGAPNIERTDRLVQAIGAQKGMRSPIVDETVATVDALVVAERVSFRGVRPTTAQDWIKQLDEIDIEILHHRDQ